MHIGDKGYKSNTVNAGYKSNVAASTEAEQNEVAVGDAIDDANEAFLDQLFEPDAGEGALGTPTTAEDSLYALSNGFTLNASATEEYEFPPFVDVLASYSDKFGITENQFDKHDLLAGRLDSSLEKINLEIANLSALCKGSASTGFGALNDLMDDPNAVALSASQRAQVQARIEQLQKVAAGIENCKVECAKHKVIMQQTWDSEKIDLMDKNGDMRIGARGDINGGFIGKDGKIYSNATMRPMFGAINPNATFNYSDTLDKIDPQDAMGVNGLDKVDLTEDACKEVPGAYYVGDVKYNAFLRLKPENTKDNYNVPYGAAYKFTPPQAVYVKVDENGNKASFLDPKEGYEECRIAAQFSTSTAGGLQQARPADPDGWVQERVTRCVFKSVDTGLESSTADLTHTVVELYGQDDVLLARIRIEGFWVNNATDNELAAASITGVNDSGGFVSLAAVTSYISTENCGERMSVDCSEINKSATRFALPEGEFEKLFGGAPDPETTAGKAYNENRNLWEAREKFETTYFTSCNTATPNWNGLNEVDELTIENDYNNRLLTKNDIEDNGPGATDTIGEFRTGVIFEGMGSFKGSAFNDLVILKDPGSKDSYPDEYKKNFDGVAQDDLNNCNLADLGGGRNAVVAKGGNNYIKNATMVNIETQDSDDNNYVYLSPVEKMELDTDQYNITSVRNSKCFVRAKGGNTSIIAQSDEFDENAASETMKNEKGTSYTQKLTKMTIDDYIDIQGSWSYSGSLNESEMATKGTTEATLDAASFEKLFKEKWDDAQDEMNDQGEKVFETLSEYDQSAGPAEQALDAEMDGFFNGLFDTFNTALQSGDDDYIDLSVTDQELA